jgi:hypothetical protein
VKLGDARIGYAGYSPEFTGPGDRRRFCAYAAEKGLAYERPRLDRPYDLVLLTHNGDIPGWIERKRRDGDRLKFVFELADSYFVHTGPMRRYLKGTARRLLGTDSRLSPDFLNTLIHACEAADAVICSTEEQRETIRRYNPKVFISFDYFADELGPPKAEYRREGKLKVVWEGQSTTLPNLQAIRGPLNDLRDQIELHVVTDPVIHRFFGRFSSYPSMDVLAGIECEKHFHRWDRATFSSRITACDLAVIPIDSSNEMARGKPENKLVLLWQLGMPVLPTATPAYSRAMSAAGVEMTCSTSADWGAQLERLLDPERADLERVGQHCRAFAERAYSKQIFLNRFDQAFEAAGFSLS